ncbi:antA/AntB antirepressor family protein [Akkermansiaceae bacterium]|nr:antA/AntB antirepressor family protein [Akkermansiaceae bacterium]
MTANQVYKLSGSTTPFSDWVGEQKIKYGEKFVENEEFLNANGDSTGFTEPTRTPEQVVLDNADENIEFPKGAAVSGSVNVGGTEVSGSAGVKNFPTGRVIFIAGALVVGFWAYNKYIKK